jgi:hypothetical protein
LTAGEFPQLARLIEMQLSIFSNQTAFFLHNAEFILSQLPRRSKWRRPDSFNSSVFARCTPSTVFRRPDLYTLLNFKNPPCALKPDIPNTSSEMAVLPLTVRPIQPPPGSDIDFGAEIEGANLENLTGMRRCFTYRGSN